MSENDGHFYGNKPVCSLCGHYGPNTDPQPCISRLKAGEVVHWLRRRLAELEGKHALAEASFMETNAENDRFRAEIQRLRALVNDTPEMVRATYRRLDTSRIDDLLAANNRYLEEARIAKRMSAVTGTALAAAQVQIQTLREALEFYADPDSYDEAGVVATFSTQHDPTSVGSGPETETHPDFGTTAEQALQDVFGDQRPDVGCVILEAQGPPTLDDLRDRFTPAELAVVDSTFGGGAKHDEIILRMFREAALARRPVKR